MIFYELFILFFIIFFIYFIGLICLLIMGSMILKKYRTAFIIPIIVISIISFIIRISAFRDSVHLDKFGNII